MSAFRPDFLGFYGKLPSRGDFLRSGLPPDCIEALDEWACAALAASRAELGPDWPRLWLEAPIWRFRLAPGICGAAPVIGMVMPSIDKAGRYFPLFLTAGAVEARSLEGGAAWLDAAESAAIAAIAADWRPDELASKLRLIPAEDRPLPPAAAPSFWWTEGGPYRRAGHFTAAALPPPNMFAAMLADLPQPEECRR